MPGGVGAGVPAWGQNLALYMAFVNSCDSRRKRNAGKQESGRSGI